MKGLSLMEPWASLMALGHKVFETRRWAPREYRAGVAIHASLSKAYTDPQYVAELCARAGLGPIFPPDYPWPYGKILAAGNLVSCLRTEEVKILTPQERELGDYSPRRRAWGFNDFWRLPEPVHCRGGRGLWDVPAEVEAEIAAQKARVLATAAPANGNGNRHAAPAPEPPAPEPAAILEKAVAWARECGLRGEIRTEGPSRVDYPQRGHGYTVLLVDAASQVGTARFTSAGARDMWTLDTKGVNALGL